MPRINTSNRMNSLEREKLISEIYNLKRVSKWYNSNGLVAILSAAIIGLSLFLTFRSETNTKKEQLVQKEKEIIDRERKLDLKIIGFQLYELNERKDSLNHFISQLIDSLNLLSNGITNLNYQKNNLENLNAKLELKNKLIKIETEYAPIKFEIDKIASLSKDENYTITDYIPKNIRDNPIFSFRIITDLKNRLLKSNNLRIECIGLNLLAQGTNNKIWRYNLVDSIFKEVSNFQMKDSLLDNRILKHLSDNLWTQEEKGNILQKLYFILSRGFKNDYNSYNCYYQAMLIYYYDFNLVELNSDLYFKFIDFNLKMLSSDNYNTDPDYIYTLYYLSPQTLSVLFLQHYYSLSNLTLQLDYLELSKNTEAMFSTIIVTQSLKYMSYSNIESIFKNFHISQYINTLKTIEDYDPHKVIEYLEFDRPLIEKWLGKSRYILSENPELLYNTIKRDSI